MSMLTNALKDMRTYAAAAAAFFMYPQEAEAQNTLEYNRDTFTNKKNEQVYVPEQYNVNQYRFGPNRLELMFLSGLEKDKVVDNSFVDEHRKKGDASIFDGIVVGADTISVYESNGANLQDRMGAPVSKMWDTRSLTRYKNDGSGTLSADSEMLDRTLVVASAGEMEVVDGQSKKLVKKPVHIVNVLYETAEYPNSVFAYNAVISAKGNQIVHESNGQQLSDVGVMQMQFKGPEEKQDFMKDINEQANLVGGITGKLVGGAWVHQMMSQVFQSYYNENIAQKGTAEHLDVLASVNFQKALSPQTAPEFLQEIGKKLTGKTDVVLLRNLKEDAAEKIGGAAKVQSFQENKTGAVETGFGNVNKNVSYKTRF